MGKWEFKGATHTDCRNKHESEQWHNPILEYKTIYTPENDAYRDKEIAP